MEPSKFSGLIVNISASVIGKRLPLVHRALGSYLLALCGFLSMSIGMRWGTLPERTSICFALPAFLSQL
jgi:hypothetical protein